MPRANIEHLPAELGFEVLQHLDFQSLGALVAASPVLLAQYLAVQPKLDPVWLKNTLGSYLPEALAVWWTLTAKKGKLRGFQIQWLLARRGSEFPLATKIDTSIQFYWRNRLQCLPRDLTRAVTGEQRLDHKTHLWMARFKHSRIEPLVELFCHWVSGNAQDLGIPCLIRRGLSGTILQSDISTSERYRITRALYMVHILCRLRRNMSLSTSECCGMDCMARTQIELYSISNPKHLMSVQMFLIDLHLCFPTVRRSTRGTNGDRVDEMTETGRIPYSILPIHADTTQRNVARHLAAKHMLKAVEALPEALDRVRVKRHSRNNTKFHQWANSAFHVPADGEDWASNWDAEFLRSLGSGYTKGWAGSLDLHKRPCSSKATRCRGCWFSKKLASENITQLQWGYDFWNKERLERVASAAPKSGAMRALADA
ncbi:hypothetical protein QBC43DRAFT_284966 [Cladorrhinum sp. PSN259]|nr:hypothetical protein QBC43DRAFT_284966 [Cladorrhinum sp. PSN259]